MPEIVSGMFGVDPEQIRMQRMQEAYNRNMQMAQLDPAQRATAAWGNVGSGLFELGARAAGLQTPEERIATVRQQAFSQLNQDDPESFKQAALMLNQEGDTRGAAMLVQAGRKAEQDKAKAAIESRKIQVAEEANRIREEALFKEKSPALKVEEIGVDGGLYQKAIINQDGTIKPIGSPYQKREDKTAKEDAAVKKMEIGQKQLTSITDQLKQYYNELDKQGAIVSTKRNAADNIKARTLLSQYGQGLAGAIGTEAQSTLNKIKAIRPALVSAMKNATGKSSSEMNSDRDIRLALDQATDPNFGLEANLDQLEFLNKTYGLGLNIPTEQKPADTKKRVKFSDLP